VTIVDKPEKSVGHSFNIGNPGNNIQVKELANLMIEMYSKLTGKPLGKTVDISGEEYYGKGYEDSDLRIPSMRKCREQLGWEPKTTLNQAMEMTMKVFIEKYADKLAGLKRAADGDETAAKKAKA